MKLTSAITDFILHCKIEKHLTPKTVKAYQTDLRQVTIFLNEDMIITDMGKEKIRGYISSISHLKPKSIKRKIATLKALINYLEFEDKLAINPFRKMRIKIKEPQTLRPVMDIAEIKKIFKSCYKIQDQVIDRESYSQFSAIRDVVVIELLFSTGARVAEIANLKWQNINFHTGVIVIKGKGDKERVIQICNIETIKILKKYAQYFEKDISTGDKWFLINRLGKRLSEQSIRIMVTKISRSAGISKHITPHVFRHTFATLLLEKEVDIKYIQTLLGHSSIMTTQIYTHVNQKRQRQILTTKHPRRDFSMNNELV